MVLECLCLSLQGRKSGLCMKRRDEKWGREADYIKPLDN